MVMAALGHRCGAYVEAPVGTAGGGLDTPRALRAARRDYRRGVGAAVAGQGTPWCPRFTLPVPRKRNFCSRFPS